MCRPATWKREVVPDHKFDFIDTRDYHDTSISTRFRYFWVYVLVIKSFLVYVADIYTAITMLTSSSWSNSIYDSCKEKNGCVPIPFEYGQWILGGSIIFSFLLLVYEARKAKKIIASRDISFAFTNPMASDYYSLRSYDHFCFFCNIEKSTKKKDDFAFFIFFTFKEWKRLILADGPRAVINGLTLYSFILSKQKSPGAWWEIKKYFNSDLTTSFLLATIIFTVLIFAGSLFLLIIAGLAYIPLLCYIQGNLKEYCCHKVDKRIDELIKRKHKQRIAKQRKEAAGDFSPHKNKKGEATGQLREPTLPNLSVDDDDKSTRPLQSSIGAGSLHYASSINTSVNDYYHGGDFPPMPMYENTHAYSPGHEYDANVYGNEYLVQHPPYGDYIVQHSPYAPQHPLAHPSLTRDAFTGRDQYGSGYEGPNISGQPIPRLPTNAGSESQEGSRRRSTRLAYDDDDEPEQFVVPSRDESPSQYADAVSPTRHRTPSYQHHFVPPSPSSRQAPPVYQYQMRQHVPSPTRQDTHAY